MSTKITDGKQTDAIVRSRGWAHPRAPPHTPAHPPGRSEREPLTAHPPWCAPLGIPLVPVIADEECAEGVLVSYLELIVVASPVFDEEAELAEPASVPRRLQLRDGAAGGGLHAGDVRIFTTTLAVLQHALECGTQEAAADEPLLLELRSRLRERQRQCMDIIAV